MSHKGCVTCHMRSHRFRLRQFDSGVLVVQSMLHSEETVVMETAKIVSWPDRRCDLSCGDALPRPLRWGRRGT